MDKILFLWYNGKNKKGGIGIFEETQWEALLGEHRLPCLLAEVDTGKIIYINQEMEGFSGNIIGETLRDLLQKNTKIPSLDFLDVWKNKDIVRQKLYYKILNRSYLLTHMYLTLDGVGYHLCKFKADDNLDFNFEESMSKCIVATQEENKLPLLLNILGDYYRAEKTYLFRVEETGIPCVASWAKDASIPLTVDLTGKIPLSELLTWIDTRNDVGMIDATRHHESCGEGTMGWAILETFSLDNMVMSVVEDNNHQALGLLVVSNRRNMNVDFRLLQAVSQFMERDISQKELKQTVQQLSDMDILTGFYNRISYSQTVEFMETHPPKRLGVILANVNGLKQINLEYGLAKGDTYIKKAAEQIQSQFNIDFFRTAGDEFVGFFPDVEKEVFQQQVSDLLETMRKSEDHIFALGHAWGKGRINVSELVKEADTVMYINKQEFYHSSTRYFQDVTDNTLQDLLYGLSEKEFIVYLQPQVILKDSTLYGAEALVRRVDSKTKKMKYPDQFIPQYEMKSVIRHIDIFVMEEVCEMLSQWKKNGIQIPISVNLSRVTLMEHGIVDTIADICDRHQIERQYLVIEVTERVGLIDNNVSTALVNEFKEKGFKISLDDFGCAYSNIVTLVQIEVDEVKIDKSLVDYLESNKKNQVLVKNVLSMCHELDRTSTLAEGIENQDQADLLESLGCHLGQGYFYSEPIPVSEFSQKYFNF